MVAAVVLILLFLFGQVVVRRAFFFLVRRAPKFHTLQHDRTQCTCFFTGTVNIPSIVFDTEAMTGSPKDRYVQSWPSQVDPPNQLEN